MEDILAIILVLAGVALATLAVRAQWRLWQRRKKREAEEAAQERARQIEDTRKWRESMRTKMSTPPPPKKHEFVKRDESFGVARGSELTASHAQSVSSYQDNFLSDIVTAVAINSLLSNTHKSGGSDPIDLPKEERSVGVSKSESSWGFDDSDSRKSISSSMDTSSWSSSSDSYSSSSSDSGPSSDW
jgi:hypothetical protein